MLPIAVGCPSGPIARAGKPGGGGINPPAAGAAAGMTSMPAAAATQPGQNLFRVSRSDKLEGISRLSVPDRYYCWTR